ncbi:MAG: IS1182 family transposase, partial [Bacteroidales bacterium]
MKRFKSYTQNQLSLFTDLLDYLSEQGYIRIETYFVDGTKLEADANKYSYVWKKNTIRYKTNLKAKVQELLREIHELNADEDIKYGNQSLEEFGDNTDIDSEELKLVVSEL